MRNYEKTNYPRIYANVYWGNFEYKDIYEIAIANRNTLASELKISGVKRGGKAGVLASYLSNNKFTRDFVDHLEIYKQSDSDNIIFINSPYDHIYNYDIDKFMKFTGFRIICPVYGDGAVSMALILDKKQIQDLICKLK